MFWTPAALAGLLLGSNMSDETPSSPEISPSPKAASAPRVRRISTPRPKKIAKAAASEEPATDEMPSIPFPSSVAPEREDDSEAPAQPGADWPEPDAESAGGTQAPAEGGSKRKRRRRKGKGQSAGPQNGGGQATEDVYTIATPEPVKSAEAAPQEQRPRPAPQPHQPQRPKVDPELLTKMAWKIYLAEVSEEGVALIGDSDAKDLSRRCFRLAEIFIEEQARRR
jgi:hypothetical protein